MTREHVVRLTVLTACIFAFSMWMQKGTWIFPFPLYDSAMLIAVVALYLVDRKKPDVLGTLAYGWALLQVFASQFVLEFFVRSEHADAFYDSPFTDYVLLAFAIVFAVWGCLVSLRLQKPLPKIAAIFACILFFVLFLLNCYTWAMIPLTGWLICLFADEKEATIHRNILFLFTFFFLSKHLTVFLLAE